MKNFARLAAVAAAATLAAAPALANTPVAADPKAQASAKIVKPLTLVKLVGGDLNFGTIVVGTLAGAETVSVDATSGLVTCGSSGNLTCSGTTSAAQYRVTGTNNMSIRVDTEASDLTNTTSGGLETLQFTPDADFDLTLTNAGAPGDLFNIGGSISIDSSTVDGLYEGFVEVEVYYN
jgi:hypothetical protein